MGLKVGFETFSGGGWQMMALRGNNASHQNNLPWFSTPRGSRVRLISRITVTAWPCCGAPVKPNSPSS